MTELEPFVFDGRPVRVVTGEDGEPWFVAVDIARELGHPEAAFMTRILEPGDKGLRLMQTPGGMQDVLTISEPGLYSVIMKRQTGRNADPATKQRVAAFQRWVTHQVLPAIRRTGTYQLPAPRPAELDRRALAMMVLEAEDARQAAEQLAIEAHARVAELEPRAAAADRIFDAAGTWSVAEAARILREDPAIDTGEIRLFRVLRGQLKWLTVDGQPRQKYLDQGLMKTKARSYRHPNSGEIVKAESQVRITGKGLAKLHQLLGGTAELDALIGGLQESADAEEPLRALR